ncbi:MAG: hypothetical protein ACOX6S_06220 [Clostridia bacterium]
MKKVLSFALVAVFIFSLVLTGCGSEDGYEHSRRVQRGTGPTSSG